MTRILLIDADPAERLILSSRVKEARYEVTTAETGAAGLIEVRGGEFDLILLASTLGTGVSGIEVCQRLRAIPRMGSVPVLMYCTKNCTPELYERAYKAGCEVFLSKAQLPALIQVSQALLRIKSRNDEMNERNRVLEQENRRLDEECRDLVEKREHGGGAVDEAVQLGASERPDGVLVVDCSGRVLQMDRGARELLGGPMEGKSLGTLAPASGLEAFVRDARTEPREGFRFDLPSRLQRTGRSLLASVLPVTGYAAEDSGGRRVVLLFDYGKRRLSEEAGSASVPLITRLQLGTLLEAARTMFRPDAFIGRSVAAARIRKFIVDAGQRPGPVSIHGESGTGKELVARVLHYAGTATGPFLQIRCGALSEESLERELFGYTMGALSGAVADRPGLVVLANDGTLYLAEIGHLSLELQHKLLQVLESGTVQRLGSSTREPVDVRLVASSSQDLDALVERGLFLPALRARLARNEVWLPPLRERIEDVEPLVRHFMERFGAGKEVQTVEGEALWVMEQHRWPDNVAELQDGVEQACRRAFRGTIQVEHLTRPLRDLFTELPRRELIPALRSIALRVSGSSEVEELVPRDSHAAMRPWDITDGDPISFDFYEKKALLRALDSCGGDKLATARLLRVGKSTLYRKLKRFGIT